jgi:hypothetical protein
LNTSAFTKEVTMPSDPVKPRASEEPALTHNFMITVSKPECANAILDLSFSFESDRNET